MAVELGLHDDGPDVHTDVEDDDGIKTNLCAAALAESFHVQDVAETKAADAVRESAWSVRRMRNKTRLRLTCRRRAKSEMTARGPGRRSRFLSRLSKYHCQFC